MAHHFSPAGSRRKRSLSSYQKQIRLVLWASSLIACVLVAAFFWLLNRR